MLDNHTLRNTACFVNSLRVIADGVKVNAGLHNEKTVAVDFHVPVSQSLGNRYLIGIICSCIDGIGRNHEDIETARNTQIVIAATRQRVYSSGDTFPRKGSDEASPNRVRVPWRSNRLHQFPIHRIHDKLEADPFPRLAQCLSFFIDLSQKIEGTTVTTLLIDPTIIDRNILMNS